MKICQTCSTALQDILTQPFCKQRYKARLPIYPIVRRSACWICSSLVSWVEERYPEVYRKWRGTPLNVEFWMFGGYEFGKPSQKDTPILPQDLAITPEGIDDQYMILLGFASRNDLSKYVFSGTPDYKANLDLIKSWNDRCVNTHSKCRSMVRGSWFPTRLLHLVRDSHGILVKLIISKEASIRGRRYMTLSHRWPINADHRLMLTKSTFEQLQRGIDYRKLPRSFQESMELACCLGVNYIWIDSLCIHQDKDDLSDWEKEAVTMHKVYSHSFLNISATFSYDGTESLFNRPNTWTTTRPTQVKVNVNGTPRHAHLIPGDIWNDEITDAPLNKRGWVFQERFLARRVLHFGRSQLAWECCEWEALEMFPNGVPFTFIAGSNSKSSVIAARNRIRYKPCLNSNHKASMALYDSSTVTEFIKWRNGIVEDYSKCQFTFYRDKLVAFGGVARSNILTLDSPDRYIVGMWERSMIYDLAWQRIHTMALSPPARQTQELHVPSWSWASFRGEVVFPHILPTKSMSHFATLVDIIGTPDQELQVDQGSFKGVSLQLECFVFEISLLPSDDEEINGIKLNQFNMVFMQENAVLEDSVGTVIDLDKDDPSIPRGKTLQMLAQEGRLFLVPLYATFNLRAMIVARLGHTGRTYCRLGAFEVAIYWESFEPTDIGQSSRQPGWGANLQAVGLKSFMDKTPKVLNGNAHYQRIEII